MNLNYREIFILLDGLKLMNNINPQRLKDIGIDYEDVNTKLVAELLKQQNKLLNSLQKKGVAKKITNHTFDFDESELTTQKLTMDEEYLIAQLLGR